MIHTAVNFCSETDNKEWWVSIWGLALCSVIHIFFVSCLFRLIFNSFVYQSPTKCKRRAQYKNKICELQCHVVITIDNVNLRGIIILLNSSIYDKFQDPLPTYGCLSSVWLWLKTGLRGGGEHWACSNQRTGLEKFTQTTARQGQWSTELPQTNHTVRARRDKNPQRNYHCWLTVQWSPFIQSLGVLSVAQQLSLFIIKHLFPQNCSCVAVRNSSTDTKNTLRHGNHQDTQEESISGSQCLQGTLYQ